MIKAPIVIHYGPMSSEKSLTLIQEYRKARSVDEICLCYVPYKSKDSACISSRFKADKVNGIKINAKGVNNSEEIYKDFEKYIKENYEFSKENGGMFVLKRNGLLVERLRLNVIIDELQLLDDGIVNVIEDIAHNGGRVVGSLLDLDFRGLPFPLKGKRNVKSTDLLGIASEIYRHYARCAYIMEDGLACGENATRTQRFRDVEHTEHSHFNDPLIEIDPRKYIPVCEKHHFVPGKHRQIM